MKGYDLTGQRFDRLLVVASNPSDSHGSSMWLCRCECGAEIVTRGTSLRRGTVRSCGCYRKEELSKRSLTHGHTVKGRSPEYISWFSMVARCNNESHRGYKDYGGRGIKVCDRWVNSFENFLNDMGAKPSKDLSIDRIDADGDYTPENTKWSDRVEQNRNRRLFQKSSSGITGVSWLKKEQQWMVTIKANNRTVHLGRTKDLKEATKMRLEGEAKYWGRESS